MSEKKHIYIEPSDTPSLRGNEKILNGIIKSADISATGHFGNAISLELALDSSDGFSGFFMPTYNHTKHIGFIVKAIIETVKETTDDTITLSSLKGCPIRVISNSCSYVGIGNFMKNRWLRADRITEWIKEKEGYKDDEDE